MTQTSVVARLAVRELWISFRLFGLIAAFVAAGTLVALLPAPLPTTVERLAAGMGLATLVAAAMAASAVATERRAGRAAWLVTRSVPRRTVLVGWFAALVAVTLAGLAAAGMLGWLAASSVTLRLEPAGFVSLMAAAAATTMAALALGVLAGVVLPSRAATAATLVVAASLGMIAWLAPIEPTLVPGGAYAALAALTEPGGSIGPGLRSAGTGLATAALLLVAARAAMERSEL